MGDNPDRKSGMVPCCKGGLDLSHRKGRTPTPRLPGERLGEYTRQRAFHVWHGSGNAPCWGMPRKKKVGLWIVNWWRRSMS